MTRSLRRIFQITTFISAPMTARRHRPRVTRAEIAALFGPELGYVARDFGVRA